MSLTNPNKPVTEARLQEFYHRIKSYLGFTEMPSEDMSDVIDPLPSTRARYHKYSTEEQIVGEWIDGSKIYEKTIDCGALPNNTTKEVSTGITDIGTVVSLSGIASSTSRSIPLQAPNTTSNASSIQMNYELSKNCIYFRTGSDQSIYTNTVVTIQYTKTTGT